MDYPNFSPNFAIVRLIRMKINKQNFLNKKAPQSWGIKNINKEKYVLLKGYVALCYVAFFISISVFKTITTLHRTQVIQNHLITYFDSSANEYHPYHPPKSLHI